MRFFQYSRWASKQVDDVAGGHRTHVTSTLDTRKRQNQFLHGNVHIFHGRIYERENQAHKDRCIFAYVRLMICVSVCMSSGSSGDDGNNKCALHNSPQKVLCGKWKQVYLNIYELHSDPYSIPLRMLFSRHRSLLWIDFLPVALIVNGSENIAFIAKQQKMKWITVLTQ